MLPQNPTLQNFQTQLFDQFGKLGRALASPRRLALLDLLGQAPRSVEDLCRETGRSPSSVSQHLKVLREAHLIESEQDGLHHIYRLADPAVLEFWQGFRQLALSRLPELREVLRAFAENGDAIERIEEAELVSRMKSGDVVVLDVRSEEEYAAGHIAGARSAPLVDLLERIDDLPRDKEFVAYCRGPFCIMAREAVRILREQNLKARHLEAGVSEWRAQGHSVQRS
jgi:DNA-binding transcriptional ArsR family regulator